MQIGMPRNNGDLQVPQLAKEVAVQAVLPCLFRRQDPFTKLACCNVTAFLEQGLQERTSHPAQFSTPHASCPALQSDNIAGQEAVRIDCSPVRHLPEPGSKLTIVMLAPGRRDHRPSVVFIKQDALTDEELLVLSAALRAANQHAQSQLPHSPHQASQPLCCQKGRHARLF